MDEDPADEGNIVITRKVRREDDQPAERIELGQHDRAGDVDAVIGTLGHAAEPAAED
jgi:hypothetical protein